MTTKITLALFFLLFISVISFAQTPTELVKDSGVKSHKNIDAIYTQFSTAYRQLRADAVTALYTDTADYLPGGGRPLKGRAAILESFTEFFDGVRSRGETLGISFHLTQRVVEAKMGYDIGIYTLTTFKNGKQTNQGRGRFVVVTKKVGKNWYFQVDTYSNLPPEKKQP